MITINLDDDRDYQELIKKINSEIRSISNNPDEQSLEKISRAKRAMILRNIINEEFKNDHNKEQSSFNTGRPLDFYHRFKNAFTRDVDIDPGRLMGLTDGIFGMCMTLLIFGTALPEIRLLTYSDFITFIQSLIPTVGITLVCFILLSSFWLYHHEFIKIKNFNIPYLWINMFYLACISFMPFTTSIIGAYSKFFLAEVIFGINIMLTIFFFLLMLRYAYNNDFLEETPSKNEKKYIYHTFLIIMALTMIVNILDFTVSSNFIYLFLLVPLISTLRDIHFKMK